VLSRGVEAAPQICGPEIAQAFVEENPRAIISGQTLPYFPRPMKKS
jgi:hypothetical protein